MSTYNTLQLCISELCFVCVHVCVWWQPSCVILRTRISHSTGQTNCWWRLRTSLQTAKSCKCVQILCGGREPAGSAPVRATGLEAASREVGKRNVITCSLVKLLLCVCWPKNWHLERFGSPHSAITSSWLCLNVTACRKNSWCLDLIVFNPDITLNHCWCSLDFFWY